MDQVWYIFCTVCTSLLFFFYFFTFSFAVGIITLAYIRSGEEVLLIVNCAWKIGDLII